MLEDRELEYALWEDARTRSPAGEGTRLHRETLFHLESELRALLPVDEHGLRRREALLAAQPGPENTAQLLDLWGFETEWREVDNCWDTTGDWYYRTLYGRRRVRFNGPDGVPVLPSMPRYMRCQNAHCASRAQWVIDNGDHYTAVCEQHLPRR